MTFEIKKTYNAEGMRMLRSMGAFLFLFFLVQPGCAFEMYDIFNQKRAPDSQRDHLTDTKGSLMSKTVQCIAERCRQLENSPSSKTYKDTLQEICILRCLLAAQEKTDAPARLPGDMKPQRQLRSRELDDMDACVRSKCDDVPIEEYAQCVYEECMGPLRLGEYRRDNESDRENEIDMNRLFRSAADKNRKDKRVRVLGRGLAGTGSILPILKRPVPYCVDCYPTPTDLAKYSECRKMCV